MNKLIVGSVFNEPTRTDITIVDDNETEDHYVSNSFVINNYAEYANPVIIKDGRSSRRERRKNERKNKK